MSFVSHVFVFDAKSNLLCKMVGYMFSDTCINTKRKHFLALLETARKPNLKLINQCHFSDLLFIPSKTLNSPVMLTCGGIFLMSQNFFESKALSFLVSTLHIGKAVMFPF